MPKLLLIMLLFSDCLLAQTSTLLDIDPRTAKALIERLSLQFPDRVQVERMGLSQAGRDLWFARISKNDSDQKKPVIFINAVHHGDEPDTAASALQLIFDLVSRAYEAAESEALDRYSVIVMPFVNPDGYSRRQRTDILGRDLNRDYPYPGRGARRAFTAPETRAVQKIMAHYHVVGSVALHSGSNSILWPWCYTASRNPDDKKFRRIGTKVARAMGFKTVRQSFEDYPTRGEFIDYAYMQGGIPALTFEISDQRDARLDRTQSIHNAVRGMMAYIQALPHTSQPAGLRAPFSVTQAQFPFADGRSLGVP